MSSVDTLYARDTVTVKACGCECPGHHFSNRKVQDWFPASSDLLTGTYRHCSEVRHAFLRDGGIFDKSGIGTELVYWNGWRCHCGDELCGCAEGV